MAVHRRQDEPVVSPTAGQEEIRLARTSHLATGTLACPVCDAPVVPAAGSSAPSEPMSCAFCAHDGAVREFLSLAAPSRPTRVEVRVVQRSRRPVRLA